jgi:hypothetical protein
MQMPLNGFWNCPIEGANALIATSGQFKHIRVATIPNVGKTEPQSSCEGKWMESNPENAAQFSATAFHFAMMLLNLWIYRLESSTVVGEVQR